MNKIITRENALKKGKTYYFTGKPCVRDHIEKRYVSYGGCFECAQLAGKDVRKNKPELVASYKIKRRFDNPGLSRHEDVMWKMSKAGKVAPGANWDAIYAKYELAALLTIITDTKYEVDHIVPLNGEAISGLHHEDNLQVITAKANRAKSNKYNKQLN